MDDHLLGSETVLLAEDDEALRVYVGQILEKSGYVLLTAANGAEALTVAQAHQGSIDLLVTDLTMPGLGGLEVARKLMEQRPGIAVVYMSGYISGGAIEELLANGNTELLQKPFSPGALLTHARRALDARR